MGTTKAGNKTMAIGMVNQSDFIGTENLRDKNHTNHAATKGDVKTNTLAMRCVRFMDAYVNGVVLYDSKSP